MNENDILKGRLKDLANAAFRQNRYTYTNFLSAADMEVFYSNLEQLSFAGYHLWRQGILRPRYDRLWK